MSTEDQCLGCDRRCSCKCGCKGHSHMRYCLECSATAHDGLRGVIAHRAGRRAA